MTAQEKIIVKLEKAKKFLAETNMTFFDIALYCGYCDFSALGKAFKDRYGMTLNQYRKQEQK